MTIGTGRFGPTNDGVTAPVTIDKGGTGATTVVGAQRALDPVITLTISGGLVAVDRSLGRKFRLSVTANCTISNPTNMATGDDIELELVQDATGDFYVDFGTAWQKAAVGSRAGFATHLAWRYDSALATAPWRLTSDSWVAVSCTVDSSDSTAGPTAVAVTGMALMLVPTGTYEVRCHLDYDAAATSTGISALFTGPIGSSNTLMFAQNSNTGTMSLRFSSMSSSLVTGASSNAVIGGNAVVGWAKVWTVGSAVQIGVSFLTEVAASLCTVRTTSRMYVRRLA